MPALIGAARGPQERLRALERAEFARSFFDQAEVLGAFAATEGTYEDRFHYTLAASDQPSAGPSRFDSLVALTRLDMTVEDQVYGGRDSFTRVIAHER
ncbi:hypothetical protein [Loktanella sp. IMCC34160]|uniref:hypothetical protein n=1 Tax=Loktanella sp. IMCC34160 TaxID=2510646 RepID=UPI001A922E6E|nr:hypothetical protein [Loktanella sp. IMCC34160]